MDSIQHLVEITYQYGNSPCTEILYYIDSTFISNRNAINPTINITSMNEIINTGTIVNKTYSVINNNNTTLYNILVKDPSVLYTNYKKVKSF